MDQFNYRVLKWTIGTSAATIVAGGYGSGFAPNKFAERWNGFTVDSLSNVYILDTGNNRIVKWAPGAASGQVVAGGNGPGSGANQLDEPQDLAIDAQFTLFVVDSANERIQVCRIVSISFFTLRYSQISMRKLESRAIGKR